MNVILTRLIASILSAPHSLKQERKNIMRLSLGDKTFRVIRFLFGVRNPRIATALVEKPP